MNVETSPTPAEIVASRLAEPFDQADVKFKPAAVSGNRALALAYVNARAVMDRLDEAVGVHGWQDEYECLPDGSVVCRLRLRLGGEWIVKVDVGGQSEQPDEGDRRKAAFSDALKRAAVKFGVGRYLYRLPQQWCDYDPQKRQFARTPTLPPHALPRPKKTNGSEAATDLGRLVNDEEVKALFAELTRAGVDWKRVQNSGRAEIRALDLKDARMDQLTRVQYLALLPVLREAPSAVGKQ